ncbi:hypothetical protein PI125_g4423 [Phytophthora idaei]|nr:hypothetical protein PI125_g4423 [Phytophthora idaei]
MIVPEVADSVAAGELDADSSASDTRKRPKAAKPKPAREARCAAQSLPMVEASGNLVAPLVREFIEIFPEKFPPYVPPIVESGMRSTSHLVPNTASRDSDRFHATRPKQLTLSSRAVAKRDTSVRACPPDSSPMFFVRKATGGWRIVRVFNKLNDTTIPAQIPIPRKDIVSNVV